MHRFSRRDPQGHFYASSIGSYGLPCSGSSGIILVDRFLRGFTSISPSKLFLRRCARSARFYCKI